MKVTAICERSDGWWAIRVPEVEGGFTQAKRLDQVPDMVADLVHLATGTPTADVQVTVEPRLSDRSGLKLWQEASGLQEQARYYQDQAAVLARQAAAELRGQGLSVRDVAALLRISPQRVSQLERASAH